MSPIEIRQSLELLNLLLEAQQPEDDPFSLIEAASIGCTPAVNSLLKAGYSPTAVQSSSRLYSSLNKSNVNRYEWNTLAIACRGGYLDIVRLILLQGSVSLNATQDNVLTPLMAACTASSDNLEIITLLLEVGADPNVKFQSPENSCNGDTAMTMATVCNKKRVVQLLLERGADPNIQSESDKPFLNGSTALMIASIDGDLEIVQLLLKAGGDPNLKCTNGNTALACAVSSGHKMIVHELLKAGATTSDIVSIELYEASIQMSIIHMCVGRLTQEAYLQPEFMKSLAGHLKIDVKLFVEISKSRINIDDTIEILYLLLEATPKPDDDPASLIAASSIGNTQAIAMLLKAGYNPIAPLSSSKYFQAILPIMAQASEFEEILKISCPSLLIACIEGHLEAAKLLLKEIRNSNHQQETGETFLMLACQCGHKDIVQMLLENGADPNICDNNGDSALHYALLSTSSEEIKLGIIQTLLSWNINVNAQNNKGVTPLMIVSAKGYTEVLLLLLEEADPNISDDKGNTALMHGSANGQSEAVALLLMTYNADPSVIDYYGLSALCHAANNGHIEVINVLLNNYNPNQEEIDKAVTAACYGGHKESIKLLADKSNLTKYQRDILTACVSDDVEFMINQISSDLRTPLIESTGLTPLMIASSCGSDEVVQALLLICDADVNKQDNLKHSPLLYAVSGSKSISVVQYLLNNGANANAISKEETTPLDIARVSKLNDIAQLLESFGGKSYSSLMEVTVKELKEQCKTMQKVKLLLDLVFFVQGQTIATMVSTKTSVNIPSFTSTPILSTIMV